MNIRVRHLIRVCVVSVFLHCLLFLNKNDRNIKVGSYKLVPAKGIQIRREGAPWHLARAGSSLLLELWVCRLLGWHLFSFASLHCLIICTLLCLTPWLLEHFFHVHFLHGNCSSYLLQCGMFHFKHTRPSFVLSGWDRVQKTLRLLFRECFWLLLFYFWCLQISQSPNGNHEWRNRKKVGLSEVSTCNISCKK